MLAWQTEAHFSHSPITKKKKKKKVAETEMKNEKEKVLCNTHNTAIARKKLILDWILSDSGSVVVEWQI